MKNILTNVVLIIWGLVLGVMGTLVFVAVVNDILDHSGIESGNQVNSHSPVAIRE